MTASSYDEALRRVLVHEGGYSNHPSDPGGPTNWGITIHDARAYWKTAATAADVRSMPVEVAKDIYRSKYWDAMRCNDLPAGVDYAVFDYGVNSGIGRAVRVLQRLVGTDVDGEVGPNTIAATARMAAVKLINQNLRRATGVPAGPRDPGRVRHGLGPPRPGGAGRGPRHGR